jgi:hypothetical protein
MSELIAYCGLDCMKCDAYIATQAEDTSHLQQIAERWSRELKTDFSIEEVLCDGCRSQRISGWCQRICLIRPCAEQKGLETCAYCTDYLCDNLKSFLSDESDAKEYLEKTRRLLQEIV